MDRGFYFLILHLDFLLHERQRHCFMGTYCLISLFQFPIIYHHSLNKTITAYVGILLDLTKIGSCCSLIKLMWPHVSIDFNVKYLVYVTGL